MRLLQKSSKDGFQFSPLLLSFGFFFLLNALFLGGDRSTRHSASRGVQGLVELYGVTSAVIVQGNGDEFAADRLKEILLPHFQKVRLVPGREVKLKGDGLVFYVGSFTSNPAALAAFKATGYSVDWGRLGDGSYLLKTFRKGGNTTIFITGKDRIGTLYGVNDLGSFYLHFDAGRVLLNELGVVESAKLKYRWLCDRILGRQRGNAAPSGPGINSGEGPEPFADPDLPGLKSQVDFMSQARLNGLVLWGLFDSPQENTAALTEFCRYAELRGVRILPAVTLGAGVGFADRAGHPYNLATWAGSHPELRSIDSAGKLRDNTLCPSKRDNQRWYQDGLRWIYASIKAGGVYFDSSQLLPCYCAECRKTRASLKNGDSDYFKDLALFVDGASRVVLELDPNAWVSYSTRTGFDNLTFRSPNGSEQPSGLLIPISPLAGSSYPPAFPQVVPEQALALWNLAAMLEQQAWPSPFRAPARHNLGLLEWRDQPGRSQPELYFKRIQQITSQALSSNLEGFAMVTKSPLASPIAELNSLTFAEFAFNPANDRSSFLKVKLSPYYPGPDGSQLLEKLLDLLEDEDGLLPQNRAQALVLARHAAETAGGDAKQRWARWIATLENWKTP